MKIVQSNEDVLLSNVEGRGEFRIRNSAKAFGILSSGLYSNKIKAIIRELSCNAHDSHVLAGNTDEQFDVHLPNTLEPYFYVRDYGVGLDAHEIENIYTTYFESTKTESNDFIGALGLGSKSPFSYIDNFTVTAIKDGVKRIYTAYINDSGVPSIALMSEGTLAEMAENNEEGLFDPLANRNGVEVRMAVKQEDFRSFRENATEVFKWFSVEPNVIGDSHYMQRSPEYFRRDLTTGTHLLEGYNHTSYALQGNICYPLNKLSDNMELGDLANYATSGFVFEFDIGELDIAASREELSYIPMTCENILNKIKEVHREVTNFIQREVDAVDTDWEKVLVLHELDSQGSLRAAVRDYIETHDIFSKNHQNNIGYCCYKDSELKERGYDLRSFNVTWDGIMRQSKNSEYCSETSAYVSVTDIPVREDTIFVVNDTKRGYMARARHNIKHVPTSPIYKHRSNIILIDVPDQNVREDKINELLAELGNPPKVYKASELAKKDQGAVENPKSALMELVRRSRSQSYESYWSWDVSNMSLDDFDDDETYFYLPLNNMSIAYPFECEQNTDGFISHMKQISRLLTHNGAEIDLSKLYGVRKTLMSDVESMDNWVNLFDVLPEVLREVDVSDYAYLPYNDHVKSDFLCSTFFDLVKKELPETSLVRQFFDFNVGLLSNQSAKQYELSVISTYCGYYDISHEAVNRSSEIAERYKLIIETYPLLDIVQPSYYSREKHLTAVVEYVKLFEEKYQVTTELKENKDDE